MVGMDELEKIKAPLAVAAAENDQIFPAALRHESEQALKRIGVPYQLNLYSQVDHGFAVRCDLKNRIQKSAKESAFLMALQWFDEFLKDDREVVPAL